MKSHGHFRLALFLVTGNIIRFSKGSFQRGDRYWNGKPLPIGIDFSYAGALAVYANGPDNFTSIAYASGSSNGYGDYVYAIFLQKNNWAESPFTDEEREEYAPSNSWITSAKAKIGPPYEYGSFFCQKIARNILPYATYEELCDSQIKWNPQKPVSKYHDLLSQQRLSYLRTLMPKWFRTPQTPKPLTRSNFILSVLDLLEELKKQALNEHNITITSATLARPRWINYDISDLIEEACVLANIETFEQPHDRIDIVTMPPKTKGATLVLDHGLYNLEIHRNAENLDSSITGSSTSADNFGTMELLKQIASQILNPYLSNATQSTFEWSKEIPLNTLLGEINRARIEIKFGDTLKNNEENLAIGLNITNAIGMSRVVNLTNEDIKEVEDHYTEALFIQIQRFLWKSKDINHYMESLPDSACQTPYKPFHDCADKIIASHPAPSWTNNTWLEPIDQVIILSHPYYADLIYEAVNRALIYNPNITTSSDGDTCIPTHEIVAMAAARRAIDWVGYFDSTWRDWNYDEEDEDQQWDDADEEEEDALMHRGYI